MPIERLQTAKFRTGKPGAYSDQGYAQPQEPSVPSNVLALVSADSFSRLEPYKLVPVTTDAALRRELPIWGSRHGRAVFSPTPANEINVGRPLLVYVVNAAPSTRAARTFDDAEGNPALTVKARIWGPDGNKIGVKKAAGTTKGAKLQVEFEGQTFTLDNVGGDVVLRLKHTGSEATTLTATVAPDYGVTVNFTVADAIAAPGVSWSPTTLPSAGPLILTIDQDPGATLTVRVSGLDASSGEALAENVAFAAAGPLAKTTVADFATIVSVEVVGSWGTATTLDVSGLAFDLPVASYPTIASVVDAVDAHPSFTASDPTGQGDERMVADLDAAAAVDALGVDADFAADLHAIYLAFGNDEADVAATPVFPGALVIAEKAADATAPPANVTSIAKLMGGTAGTATTSVGGSWEKAFKALRAGRVNEVWPESVNATVQALALAHNDYMHGEGQGERSLHLAGAKGLTLTQIDALTAGLNRDYCKVWVQESKYRDENNVPRWFDPLYLALRAAAASAGLPNKNMPLNWKLLDVLDVRDGTGWTVADDFESLLDARATVIERVNQGDRVGFQVVRCVTTYRGSDPLRTEDSPVRVADAITQDWREFSAFVIGQPNFAGFGPGYKATMVGRLAYYRDTQRWLKSYDPQSIDFTDGGAAFVLDAADLAPVEGILWTYTRTQWSRRITTA